MLNLRVAKGNIGMAPHIPAMLLARPCRQLMLCDVSVLLHVVADISEIISIAVVFFTQRSSGTPTESSQAYPTATSPYCADDSEYL